ncbi:OmpA family protein [Chitinophagaceae bacterium LB-8]|jgi:outer membrane protein OmpA-like peptidoglycan-associated protein|uniref:OmpA family protein n=1 Tax=Paraflavisolibacter caeni TaxID=2982496 RepID=A0A9X2Y089_9BACT|nr:OmpA family protein [Paraflavisolibacter caeni]MCU7551987.1 OmpA family protein [Paraflavisolibacter caeni]
MKISFGVLLAIFFVLGTKAQETKDTVLIFFPFDQSTLTHSARRTLDSLITAFRNNPPSAQLAIYGHCDSLGSNAYNDKLSNERSNVVHNYLLNHGLTKTAISEVQGHGENRPLNDNSTPEEQQINRRVELIWPSKNEQSNAHITAKDTVIEFSKEVVDTVKEGQTLRLRNINFYGGSHQFLPEAKPALDELLDAMKRYPELEIEILGHICCLHGTGTDGVDFDAGDRNLSINRARAVYDYLIENGIDKNRMTYKGLAATIPLVYPEYSEADRTLNRRVEIKIVKR